MNQITTRSQQVDRLRLAADVLFEVASQPAIRAATAPGQEVGLARYVTDVAAVTQHAERGPTNGAELLVSRQAWEAMSVPARNQWVRENCFDCQHASGTCRMGHAADPRSVVDSQSGGRVIGVPGLRVIDASLLPTTVRGNIHLTVLMVAEKMAARVLEEYEAEEQLAGRAGLTKSQERARM